MDGGVGAGMGRVVCGLDQQLCGISVGGGRGHGAAQTAQHLAHGAVQTARKKGHDVGFIRLKTLWPFPETHMSKLLEKVERIFVVEMNMGMMVKEVAQIDLRKRVVA